MKYIIVFLVSLFFVGCFKEERKLPGYKTTKFIKSNKKIDDDFSEVLILFQKNCLSKKTQKLYGKLCKKSLHVKDPKKFFSDNFELYKVTTEKSDTGLLTGYYEASLNGSRKKHGKYSYPVYKVPKDLIEVRLSSIYPELSKYRLRGRLDGNKLVPYFKRKDAKQLNADVICYVDDKISLFFLEVQGSGRIILDNNKTIYVGYADQNGYKYRSIGKYMIQKGYIKKEDISMQSIRKFLQDHPEKVEEILNYNPSMVFFREKDKPATGALGIVLTPMRSIAIDRLKVPLGGMYFFEADRKGLKGVVFAQDVGGAIKGTIRADLFCGYGDKAEKLSGSLKAPLKLWIFLPKRENNGESIRKI